MNALQRFERLVTDLLEGSVARALGARLEPVELARRIERAMDAGRRVGPDMPIVPNEYRVNVHPDDLACLGDAVEVYARELTVYVADVARERRCRLPGPPRVTLVADPEVRPLDLVVEARMAAPLHQPVSPAAPLDQTQRFAPVVRPPTVPASPPTAGECYLVGPHGRYALSQERTCLGRALDNDVVLEDSRVSRHHAEVGRSPAGYLLRDLGSTNGTQVNGRAIQEHPISPGDRLSLGGVEIRLVQEQK
ncbi:MAG: DUF3662 domain-containing protein [Chloroflexi bacterium]|nr:DUF3662 domain-containing protein [Chloroflexota bacterium]